MAIDGIRKGGTPAIGPNAGVGSAGAPSKAFEVGQSSAAGAPPAVDAAAASSLASRVRSGELDVAGFVEAKIDHATAHLAGMSPEALGDLKQMMREKMMHDPLVSEWIAELTGKSAPKEE
jgi:hypothetical protein